MKAIVIPVKAFAEAKSRLAPGLSATARAGLAESLCRDIFDAIAHVRGVDRVYVISSEACALNWARQNGWEALGESRQISESDSVDRVCRLSQQSGVQALLRIPTDIPLVQSRDIEALFPGLGDSPGCVIVPSRDGTGTNALLRSPPSLFPSCFGEGSFARHVAAARSAGITATVLRDPRIELDVDEARDLELLRGQSAMGPHTLRWFSETGRVLQVGSNPDRFPWQESA